MILSCENKISCEVETYNLQGQRCLSNFIINEKEDDLSKSIEFFNKSLACDNSNSYAIENIVIANLYLNNVEQALKYNLLGLKYHYNSFYIEQRASIYELNNNKDSTLFYYKRALDINLILEKKHQDSLFIKAKVIELICKLGGIEKLKEKLDFYSSTLDIEDFSILKNTYTKCLDRL